MSSVLLRRKCTSMVISFKHENLHKPLALQGSIVKDVLFILLIDSCEFNGLVLQLGDVCYSVRCLMTTEEKINI